MNSKLLTDGYRPTPGKRIAESDHTRGYQPGKAAPAAAKATPPAPPKTTSSIVKPKA